MGKQGDDRTIHSRSQMDRTCIVANDKVSFVENARQLNQTGLAGEVQGARAVLQNLFSKRLFGRTAYNDGSQSAGSDSLSNL